MNLRNENSNGTTNSTINSIQSISPINSSNITIMMTPNSNNKINTCNSDSVASKNYQKFFTNDNSHLPPDLLTLPT